MDRENEKIILEFQRNEITEYSVCKMLAHLVRSKHNREVIRKISEEEFRHYNIWKEAAVLQKRESKAPKKKELTALIGLCILSRSN